ncbi:MULTISPECIES: Uma2 family endonuclease [Sulfurimonas]|uniref:Uma2 family endonuclease n=1 Tax=Sulfurimonas TaxID=202746 RepID=UPI001264093E|nr:Uma2 family endonuclease [Sulfurimonas indica]
MCAIEYYTYEDYVKWEGDWELINGVPLAMSPAPMITHQALATNIAYELKNSSDNCKECLVLHEVDYKINDDTILRPDVVLTCNETNDAYLTKAPQIIVEVISHSTAKRDEKFKFEIYEKEKVKYYLLVYPDDLKAKIYKLDGKEYDKQGDFTTESYTFEESSCKASIDFERVFKKFRK